MNLGKELLYQQKPLESITVKRYFAYQIFFLYPISIFFAKIRQ